MLDSQAALHSTELFVGACSAVFSYLSVFQSVVQAAFFLLSSPSSQLGHATCCRALQFSFAVASLPGRADVYVCTCSAVAHGAPPSAYPAIASVCSFVCMSYYILSPQYVIRLYTLVFIKELSKSWHFPLVPVFKPLLIMDIFILCPPDTQKIDKLQFWKECGEEYARRFLAGV